MASTDQLRHVKAGDRPSASQHNIIVDAVKSKQAGDNAFRSSGGFAQRPSAMKFSRISQFRVNEDVPTPPEGEEEIPARTVIKCLEIDGGDIVSDEISIALSPQTQALSRLYTKDMILFAAEVIDDFGAVDDAAQVVRWLEIVGPELEEPEGGPVDHSYTGEHAETAMTDEGWAIGDGPLKVTLQTGEMYSETGDKVLYAFMRDFTISSDGRIVAESSERRVVVDPFSEEDVCGD